MVSPDYLRFLNIAMGQAGQARSKKSEYNQLVDIPAFAVGPMGSVFSF